MHSHAQLWVGTLQPKNKQGVVHMLAHPSHWPNAAWINSSNPTLRAEEVSQGLTSLVIQSI